ncbi:MAG TPA: glycosyltransferase family 39 protein [Candidatus Methylomirabilis sp.]|nr:glycosyltransferase family 39 protein [Candidatus Methylomirabilis sp.]
MALGLGLRLWRLEQNGYGTQYYSAGVRSMMDSWHNFLFNSFDPAGFVSLDKPPVAIWVQVASAKLFGFSTLSVLLPQVVEGLASIALLYHLVARRFGAATGLLAALFLALTPISIVIDRSSNTDSCLVLVLLLAAWALTIATERGSAALLVLAMALVGVGFNVKMLAAFVVLPTFALLYFVGAPLPWHRRLAHLTVGAFVLAVVSLSWVVLYDVTPAERRPFAGSSQSNSMLELAVGHNGMERFVRRRGMLARGQGNAPAAAPGQPGAPATPFGGRLRVVDNVPVGPLRLADRHLAGQFAWLLPLAMAGVAAVAVRGTGRRPPLDLEQQAMVLWSGWALTYAIVYSYAGGIFHAYYLVTMAPPLSALAGMGVTALWSWHRRGGRRALLLPVALLITAAWQLFIWSDDLVRVRMNTGDWRLWLCLVMVLGACAASINLIAGIGSRRPIVRPSVALGMGLGALLVTPIAWALGPSVARANVTMPFAALPGAPGREDPNGQTFWRGGAAIGRDPQLLAFLRANRRGERYLLATLNARLAAPAIIETGEPVMAIGGFMGSDPILTQERFAALAADGQVRFVLLGGDFSRRGRGESPQRSITDWVKANGVAVDPALWRSTPVTTTGRAGRGTPPELYDLRPTAGLAPSGAG